MYVVRTTATHYCMASLAVRFNGCSRYRMRQHGSSVTGARRRDHITSAETASLAACEVWSRESTSNWRCWSTSFCTGSFRRTCRTIVNSVGTSGHRTFTRRADRAADTITDWWQEFHGSWTAAIKQPADWNPIERHNFWTLCGYLRHICSFRLRRIVTLFKCADPKYSYSLTHSLTYSLRHTVVTTYIPIFSNMHARSVAIVLSVGASYGN